MEKIKLFPEVILLEKTVRLSKENKEIETKRREKEEKKRNGKKEKQKKERK